MSLSIHFLPSLWGTSPRRRRPEAASSPGRREVTGFIFPIQISSAEGLSFPHSSHRTPGLLLVGATFPRVNQLTARIRRTALNQERPPSGSGGGATQPVCWDIWGPLRKEERKWMLGRSWTIILSTAGLPELQTLPGDSRPCLHSGLVLGTRSQAMAFLRYG